MSRRIDAAPRLSRRTRFGLGVALGLAATIGLWWLAPGLLDRVRYGQVASGCEGSFDLQGSDGEQGVRGHHCRVGASIETTESGFFVVFEYARDGQVILWGRGPKPRNAGDEVPLSLAIVRTPGDDGRWLCAGGGTWRVPAPDRNEVELKSVGLLLAEQGLRGDGTLTVGSNDLSAELGTWSTKAPLHGWSCDQHRTRCSVEGSELRPVRVFIRTGAEASRLGHAFVLVEDQRAAQRVGLAVTSTGEWNGETRTGTLAGLSALVDCPLATPARGALTLSWKN